MRWVRVAGWVWAVCVVVGGCSSAPSAGSPESTAANAESPAPVSTEGVPAPSGFDDADLIVVATSSGLSDPSGIEAPEPTDVAATVAWLNGEGRDAVAVVTVTDGWWRDHRGRCDSTIQRLEAIGTPEQVQEAAAGVDDDVTAEMLLGLITLVSLAADACGGSDPEAVAEFAWQWSMAARRLDTLGVPR